MDLTDASAIVTGGAGGFGSATVRKLAERGARVVIADVADDRGRALADEVSGSVYVRTDCTDEGAVVAAVQAATDLAPLRAAVVAHVGPPSPVVPGSVLHDDGTRRPVIAFDHMVDVHLKSPYLVTAVAAEAMAENEPLADDQRGVVIITVSIAGIDGPAALAGYAAAKGGIVAMVLPLARDLAPRGIRIVGIAPGPFLTLALQSAAASGEFEFEWSSMVPNPGRLGDPREYASLAAEIVANDFLNGTTIRLDGATRL